MNDINKISVSACIVAYNEEKLLRRCLDSLRGLVDEIILVHDGECQDQTLTIAREYGAKIIIGSHYGFMEPHLPAAYRLAQSEWLLRIDADEFLSEELRQALPGLLQRTDVSAYELLWLFHDGQKYLTKAWPHKLCLFRKKDISFLALPDYPTLVNGKIERVNYQLEHQPGYDNHALKTFRHKWLKLAHIRADLYSVDFSLVESFNYDKIDWPRMINLRRRYPLLILPFDFLVVFCTTISEGFAEGYITWRVALLHGYLRVAIDWLLFKKKWKF